MLHSDIYANPGPGSFLFFGKKKSDTKKKENQEREYWSGKSASHKER